MHMELMDLDEENEEGEVPSEIGEGDVFNSGHNEKEVFETKGTLELQKGR